MQVVDVVEEHVVLVASLAVVIVSVSWAPTALVMTTEVIVLPAVVVVLVCAHMASGEKNQANNQGVSGCLINMDRRMSLPASIPE